MKCGACLEEVGHGTVTLKGIFFFPVASPCPLFSPLPNCHDIYLHHAMIPASREIRKVWSQLATEIVISEAMRQIIPSLK